MDLRRCLMSWGFAKESKFYLDLYHEIYRLYSEAKGKSPPEILELRSHVVGRKTWYGTHSERGAQTAAVLFSLVETCKHNDVNPREYSKNLVEDLMLGKNPYTPRDFKNLHQS